MMRGAHTLPVLLAGILFATGMPGYGQHQALKAPVADRGFLELEALMGSVRAEDQPLKCGFPVIANALRVRSTLSPRLESVLLHVLQRDERQKNIVVGHFRIHYDTTGSLAAAMLDATLQPIPGTADQYADSAAAIANQVYDVEIGALGYQSPPGDGTDGGGPEYDIYIQPLSYQMYGDTTPERQLSGGGNGGRWTTFIRVDNTFSWVRPVANAGLPALRVTIAHEFHHAIQIGSYAYWVGDEFYYEITSTWMEDVVYTNVNDYYNYLSLAQGQFRNPELPFTTVNGGVEYSRALWGHFIAKRFGRDAMRRSWEYIATYRPLDAIDRALHEMPYASGLKESFAEWTLWNYFTGTRSDSVKYYPEGRNYPLISQAGIGYTPPSRQIPGSLQPLSTKYYQVVTTPDTVTLAVANLDITAAQAGSQTAYPYSYLLSAFQPDATYHVTGAGFFVKLSVDVPSNWWSWDIFQSGIGSSGSEEGVPFPNPFRPDFNAFVFIPVRDLQPVNGTLTIFSSSMDRVYGASQVSTPHVGRQVFSWNGRTDKGTEATSGIYMYVISLIDRSVTGKIALLRK